MFFASIIVAVFGLATLGRSHMKMSTPTPYGKSSLDTDPLSFNGSDFPCKQRTGVYDIEEATNTMPLGSVQPLEFIGIIVHGGGSCQVSITYDLQPTNLSVFKVIHSIEGGCLAKDTQGNLDSGTATSPDPFTYSFTVPPSLPTGNATVAWTWFNKEGNREMYMNCAPVDITAAAPSRRSGEDDLRTKRDQAAFNALPNMFVGNIGGGGAAGGYPHCGTNANTNLIFPDPGASVDQFNTDELSIRVGPTGQCAGTGSTLSNYGSVGLQQTALRSIASASTFVAVTAKSAPNAATGVASTATTSASSYSTTTTVAEFVTISVAPATVTATDIISTTSTTTNSSSTTSMTSSTATASAPVNSASASASASLEGGQEDSSKPTPVSTGSGIAQTGSCITEGMWNCIGGSSFQQCASGSWSASQQMAAGTTCQAGQSMDLGIVAKPKRAIRFSGEHVHMREAF